MHRPDPTLRRLTSRCSPLAIIAGVAAVMLAPPCQIRAIAQPIAKTESAAVAALVQGAPKAGPAATVNLTMEQYLDRVMMAESGGRVDLRSSRSTAVGPYQFIERTFFEVARRNFPAETLQLPFAQLLALRSDPKFARRVAEAYTRETASYLASQDIAPTWQHLRLAYIVGPGGAVRLLKAPPDAPLAGLLGPAALNANPFMAGMSARALLAKATRDVAVQPGSVDGVDPGPRRLGTRPTVAGVPVRCNLALPSCKKWVALHQAAAPRLASRSPRR